MLNSKVHHPVGSTSRSSDGVEWSFVSGLKLRCAGRERCCSGRRKRQARFSDRERPLQPRTKYWVCQKLEKLVMTGWSSAGKLPCNRTTRPRRRAERRRSLHFHHTGCKCPTKSIIFKITVQCRLIGLSMAMSRSTYGSPTSRLDKDCGLLHPTIYSFLLSQSG